MNEFRRDYDRADGRYHVELCSGNDEIWVELTLPSAAKIPIRFINGEPVSTLIHGHEIRGVYADLVAIKTIPESLSAESRDVVLRAISEFHNSD